ncbi:Start1 [Anopheles darlingi]|uniref:Start1 n=1 Tax=Anopheles darlingi TaxID=43151 RepID=W5JAE9_ANODA|nr:steroidogenic acute regulatory protein-like [Anopheles darlingi]XP_049541005.1 steroidogenic acute regulatory protein-like [Anopheles darlingi]XP_049541006.1 steroidogenic acute regulatory protein-like [Anopheles darlingi]XP_049541007.1 steroidogenic acute regulatory protein-like [Anopheles darlingi]XP_049541008.1 steroidogenic acute regulatory protein-like [Anopheles darlingi]XP_049541009.1 steroidogenic acute regulatory protein-like [Anopheles darlingi]ETN59759.1 Start1 [Anopheles darlin
MSEEHAIRTAVHTIYRQQQDQQHPPGLLMYRGLPGYGSGPPQSTLAMSRSQSQSFNRMYNLLSEDLLAGYMEQGRMSVVRRFFCLFVTFDLVFISLLWIICVVIKGQNVLSALEAQVVHYTVQSSLFDVVAVAFIRFIVLILCYGLLGISHWVVIALSTTSSCGLLICKVILYDWTATSQPVFEVLLIVVSFVLAWSEAWFLDCRVIPQERYISNYLTATGPTSVDANTPLLQPYMTIAAGGESVGNFYSPFESAHNSDEDDDEDAQDDQYKQMGLECVRTAYDLLESDNWKLEKTTNKGDTIHSCQVDQLGKVYKVTGIIDYPAERLLRELFYKIEDMPKWNHSIIVSKIMRKIDSHTDVTYQSTTGGGGGVVKCREFVNLRCWRVCRGGQVCEPTYETDERSEQDSEDAQSGTESNGHYESSGDVAPAIGSSKMSQSHSELKLKRATDETAFKTLSKSLGAQDFAADGAKEDGLPSVLLEEEASARDRHSDLKFTKGSKVYVSAATSIDHPGVVLTTKFIRGENKISCWAMRELDNQKDRCIFQWLLCLDLKGYIPRYVLDTAYTTLIQDYMNSLRKHVAKLSQQAIVSPNNQ